ncbi:transposase [Leuconostoc falkenbergense]|uniref:IS110 family transposase n=1 Tax=Leuconostoc falkenbergense TaxID=2766470 RepID=UPI0024AE545C|nr:transposase [Leuconostoc falkenbergense]MDI6667664.1 transposase [Leuconostoc falkenbergense]
MIKEFAKTLTLRKTKTDKADALTIDNKLAPDLSPDRFKPAFNMQELKFLTRHRNRMTDNRSKLKTQYIRLLDILFPELAGFLGKTNLHNQYVYDLLTRYPSPAKLSRSHTSALMKLLRNRGDRSDTAHRLKKLAKQSIGLSSPANELELLQTIAMMRLYSDQIAVVDQEVSQLMAGLDEATIITSITGISNRLGSIILAEISNLNNFKSPDQLLAFAGLDPPFTNQGR